MAFARIPGDQASGPVSIKVADGPSADAFARLRVSDPTTIFDSQLQYGQRTLLWRSAVTSNGTTSHLSHEASVRLSTTTDSGSQVVRETYQYHRYQPGKSQLVVTTGVFGPTQSGVTKRMGYFDEENGVFLEQAGSTTNVVLRSYASGSVAETRVPMTSWNLDRFNGGGSSGVSADFSKGVIFATDMEWLGLGRVRTGFFYHGVFQPAHQFLHAGAVDGVYMTTANLPVRYEITSTNTTSADSMKQICCTVISEGGFEIDRGDVVSVAYSDGTAVTTTAKPVMSIRPKATYGDSGLTNYGTVLPTVIEAMALTSPVYYEVIYDGTLTAPTWRSVNDRSLVESDFSATAISGGLRIAAGYIPASGTGVNSRPASSDDNLLSKLALVHNKTTGVGIPLTIVAKTVTGSGTFHPAMTWRELL